MITLAFYDNHPPLAVYDNVDEQRHSGADVERICGKGVGGCVLIFPNFPGDTCFTVVDRDRAADWSLATRRDCKIYRDGFRK